MGQESLGGDDLTELRAAYTQKIHRELPATATPEWPICRDHCFARVVLDNLFQEQWDSHVSGRPAFEQLSPDELRAAIELADRMLEKGKPAVEELNNNSLRWRDERQLS